MRALDFVGAGCTRRQRDILAALAGDLDLPILWRRTGWEYAGSKECGRAEVVTATAFIFEMQANRNTDTKPQLIWIEREAGQSDGDRLGGVPRWLRPRGPGAPTEAWPAEQSSLRLFGSLGHSLPHWLKPRILGRRFHSFEQRLQITDRIRLVQHAL